MQLAAVKTDLTLSAFGGKPDVNDIDHGRLLLARTGHKKNNRKLEGQIIIEVRHDSPGYHDPNRLGNFEKYRSIALKMIE